MRGVWTRVVFERTLPRDVYRKLHRQEDCSGTVLVDLGDGTIFHFDLVIQGSSRHTRGGCDRPAGTSRSAASRRITMTYGDCIAPTAIPGRGREQEVLVLIGVILRSEEHTSELQSRQYL